MALVQNLGTEEVLQAALAAPDYKANIVIDCEPDGVGAGWTLTGPYGVLAAGNGDRSLDAFYAGEFSLQWEDVTYWNGPAPGTMVQIVAEGGQLVFTGQYSDGPLAAAVATPGAAAAATRGVSIIDWDGDGDLDLHVLNEGSADDLLRNDGGTFVAAGSGPVLDPGDGCSSAWADFNGDGNLDVYMGRNGQANLLLAGDGNGGFAPANVYGIDNAGQARTVAWVDYDRDDILDLYVVNNGGANVLLKGMGDVGGGFYIYSLQSNGAGDPGNGRGMAWADIDFDGRLDVYVVNSFAANVLMQNLPQGFNIISAGTGIDDGGNGAGAAWGDLDNDGDWDLYVANDGTADRLYRADAFDSYNLVLGANLGDRGHAQGVVFADLDNDTRLDLYVARSAEPDLMLIGDGAGGFVRAPVGWPEAELGSKGVACGDIDGDGDLDLFVSRDGAPDVLYENVIATDNHWFAVRLHGTAGNRGAIGARVQVVGGGVTQMRQLSGGGGYLGMDGGPAHFGLGSGTVVDELTITWPDGSVQTAGPLTVDQLLDVTYGQAISAVGDPVPTAVNRLGAPRPNPFNPQTTIEYALAADGPVRLEVFSVDGRRVAVLVDGPQAAGSHSATWQGRDSAGRAVASGTYMYRLTHARRRGAQRADGVGEVGPTDPTLRHEGPGCGPGAFAVPADAVFPENPFIAVRIPHPDTDALPWGQQQTTRRQEQTMKTIALIATACAVLTLAAAAMAGEHPTKTASYAKAGQAMEKLGADMMNGTVNPMTVKMCGSCTEFGQLMMAGVTMENVDGDAADVTVITSADPALVTRIHKYCDRNNKEMALLMGGDHAGHGH